jgi:MFS family permease
MSSNAYRRYITVLLLVVYIFNQTDRGIFGFLMEPIKLELGLSDTQLGFLAGPAMVVFYAALGVPVARLADRSSRVNIISIAVALWSGIVTLSAAVGTFWQFVLVRVGVGVGEAGFTAVAQSLISDSHSPKQRTRALSIFMLGIPLGGAVCSLLAGWINEIYGWRAVFIAAGVPGIVLAILVKWTVKEPPRLAFSGASAETQPPLRSVLDTLWRLKALKHLAIAQGLVNVLACFLGWFPVFFMRVHHVGSGELGTWLAVTAGVGGTAGIWLGGYLTSRYGDHDVRVQVRIMSVATALIAPAAVLALWYPSAQLALVLLLPFKVLLFFCYGPTFSFVQTISPAGMRATMASVFILIQVLAGGVIGTQLLGILSDLLTPTLGNSGDALRLGMTLASPLALWAAVHFWLAGRSIRQDVLEENSGHAHEIATNKE